jgi:hypothetical protein
MVRTIERPVWQNDEADRLQNMRGHTNQGSGRSLEIADVNQSILTALSSQCQSTINATICELVLAPQGS